MHSVVPTALDLVDSVVSAALDLADSLVSAALASPVCPQSTEIKQHSGSDRLPHKECTRLVKVTANSVTRLAQVTPLWYKQ